MMLKVKNNHTLRTLIRERILKNTEANEVVPGLRYIYNKKNAGPIRLLWLLLIVSSSTVTLYQIFDRIVYYFTYPVAVNIFLTDRKNIALPSITFCSASDTKMFAHYRKVFETEKHKEVQDRYCLGETLVLVKELKNVTLYEFWDLFPTSEVFHEGKLIIGKKTINLTREMFIDVYTPFGLCSTFEMGDYDNLRGIFITLKKAEGACKLSQVLIYLHPYNTKPMPKLLTAMPSGTKVDTFIEQKMYVFVDTPVNPCVSFKDYFECEENCILEKLKQHENVTCFLPFLPKKLNYSECDKNDLETYEQCLRGSTQVYSNTVASKDCNCPRSCEQISANIFATLTKTDDLTTIFNVKVDNNVRKMIEIRAYEIIALFCDIGGNLGLLLGLSILSIFEVFFEMFKSANKSANDKKQIFNLQNNSMCTKIDKLILRIQARRLQSTSNSSTFSRLREKFFPENKSFWLNFNQIFAQIACFLLFSYLMTNRIEYYFTYPSRNVVQINLNKTVHFPDITLCATSISIIESMEQFSTMFPKRFKNYCDVTLLDLLDGGISAESIWNASSIRSTIINRKGLEAEKFFSIPVIRNVSVEEVAMPEGLCIRFKPGEQNYAGFITLFSIIADLYEECSNIANLYISPIGKPEEIRYKETLRISVTSLTSLHIKTLQLLDSPIRPCENIEQKSTQCKQNCIREKLRKEVRCRLPYMLKFNISMCTTYQTALKAELVFKKIVLTTDPIKDCSCKIPCKEITIRTRISNLPYTPDDFTINMVNFFSGIFETFYEVGDYTFVKLLCDIGGALGVMLGLCVLSIIDSMHLITSLLIQQVVNKNKKLSRY